MSTAVPGLWTLSDLAETLGTPRHRLSYAVRSRQIRPAARVGHTDLFDREAAARVELAVAEASERPARRKDDRP